MLEYLLGSKIYGCVTAYVKESDLTEVSVRANRRIAVKNTSSKRTVEYTPTTDEVKAIILRATKNSLYAYQDEIKRGYVTFDGIRIGICGSAVTDGNELLTIKDITSLNVRIPHEVLGCANRLKNLIDGDSGVLIISPPLCGKTTIIRDLARISSEKYDTLVIDERGEIYSPRYTFGQYFDVIKDAPKSIVAEGVLRSMSPETVVLDEIYFKRDLPSITELNASGIKVIASAHVKDFTKLSEELRRTIKEHFDYVVTLSNNPAVGSIKSIVKL